MVRLWELQEVHAALGEPARLAIVEDLALSDRSPGELSIRHGLPGNLLAHHLGKLEQAGLVERLVSGGDRRRRYIRLRSDALSGLGIAPARPQGAVLFVCTHNWMSTDGHRFGAIGLRWNQATTDVEPDVRVIAI